jgi:hypothetical protein
MRLSKVGVISALNVGGPTLHKQAQRQRGIRDEGEL